MLQGLYLTDLAQLRAGYPGILRALRPGTGVSGPGSRRLRYIRRDNREHWKNLREIWHTGGGDCEDLAAAVAAEITLLGAPARPVVRRVRAGLAHAVVELHDGTLLDPSILGGMHERQDLGAVALTAASALQIARILALIRKQRAAQGRAWRPFARRGRR